jgi:cytochrome c oxidase subunit III
MFKKRNTFELMLLMAMFGSALFFLFLLFVYSVRKSQSTFPEIALPTIFWYSTGIILLSSLTLYLAQRVFRQDQFVQYRFWMGSTFLLGALFCGMQALGWQQIHLQTANPAANMSGGFIYLLSGMHLLHIVVGLFFLGKIWWEALRRQQYVEAFVYSVNPPNQLRIGLVVFYWHFVDALWLILFGFLCWQRY